MNSLQRIIVLSVLSCVLAALPGCRKETEQDRVKKVITDIQRSAEEKDIKKIIDSLSKTYRDPREFTYDTMKGMLLGYFFRYQKIHVYITNLDVTVHEGSATAAFHALLSGGEKTGSLAAILPEALGLYDFEVSFLKESGDWKVTSAKWDRIADK